MPAPCPWRRHWRADFRANDRVASTPCHPRRRPVTHVFAYARNSWVGGINPAGTPSPLFGVNRLETVNCSDGKRLRPVAESSRRARDRETHELQTRLSISVSPAKRLSTAPGEAEFWSRRRALMHGGRRIDLSFGRHMLLRWLRPWPWRPWLAQWRPGWRGRGWWRGAGGAAAAGGAGASSGPGGGTSEGMAQTGTGPNGAAGNSVASDTGKSNTMASSGYKPSANDPGSPSNGNSTSAAKGNSMRQ